MMMNKKLLLLLFGFITLVLSTSCKDDENVTIYGNWVEGSLFDGAPRAHAASFTIDDKFYFGLGFNGSRATGNQYFSDFYSYEGGTSWPKLAEFPGAKREGAFCFAVDGKGYVGGGYYGDTTEVYFDDVWQYDPASNAWTQLADFPGGKRTEATTFVVGGKAYVAGGRYESDATEKDCWKFDSSTGTFTQVESMGHKRSGAFSFVIGDRAYVGGGVHTSYVRAFEYFDATTEKWKVNELRDLELSSSITDGISHYDKPLNLMRRWASAFVKDGKGYIVGGNYNSVLNDCWEYDPKTDLWTEKNNFESNMEPREKASSFVINNTPYIVAGQVGATFLDDVWRFDPTAEENLND